MYYTCCSLPRLEYILQLNWITLIENIILIDYFFKFEYLFKLNCQIISVNFIRIIISINIKHDKQIKWMQKCFTMII